jgi:hypothetical protein
MAVRGALLRRRDADKFPAVLLRSDGAGAFGEERWEPMSLVNIYAEFIVAATEVLHERVSGTDHPGQAELSQTAHRPQPWTFRCL